METFKKVEEPIIRPDCRTRRGLELIADQWTMLVVVALGEDTKRFSWLHAHIVGISKKMLTQTLRGLERNGLVKRVVYPVIPPMVEYSLTPLGRTLSKPILALRDWSEEYIEEVEQARAEYDQQDRNSLQDEIIALVQQRADMPPNARS
ncbi:transcriptional regulator [Reticulibacter mediterranei]|jgi:DNA-binding HxlR family transcriptional regulator|uniref:Transcriptional regulator n=1 Tax=Reticulibacter mediterranei TaxID=2778369 RepID=A0A8J3IEU3_9CHLR|nr:helix-turn-helix domain-containing protein [Reticulibacter mediterranei]GHO94064.1 transcriptional regulator [Reticulibacter mediterranei]